MADRVYPASDNIVIQVPTGSQPPPHPYPKTFPTRRRHRSCCCCFFKWLCSFIAALLILIIVGALVFFFVMKPRLPKYNVQSVDITAFNVTSETSGAAYLTSHVVFTVSARNPNKKIGIYYREVDSRLIYKDVEIAKGGIDPFYQGHKNTTILHVPLDGEKVLLSEDKASTLTNSLQNKDTIPFRINTAAQVKLKLGGWKLNLHINVRVKCDVEVTAPSPGSSTTSLVSDSCKFRVKF